MEIKIKEVVRYAGHNLSANGTVNLTVKAMYSELTNTVKAMQALNNDVTIKAKIAGEKAKNLGIFRIKQIIIDGDGESKLKFNGISDYIEMDNLNALPLNDDEVKDFIIMMSSEIESEEEEGGGEE